MNTKQLLKSTYVLISGKNGLGDKTSDLKSDLAYAGYPALDCIGKYCGYTEDSLLVPNLPIGLAHKFAQAYHQESFITAHDGKATMVFTENGNTLHANNFTLFRSLPDTDFTYIKALDIGFTFNFNWG
jgi:hypothetical protein